MIDWCQRYPVISIEDPAADTDWDAWKKIKTAIGFQVQIIGDDLFTTNPKRIQEGIEKDAANALNGGSKEFERVENGLYHRAAPVKLFASCNR